MPLKFFISYSHKDDSYRRQLETILFPLEKKHEIELWCDRKLIPGSDWDEEINKKLLSSDVILFLISPDFIASTYCIDTEIKNALKQANKGTATLIPIVVRVCNWQDWFGLNKFNCLPDNGKPIKHWDDKDEAWLNVLEGIEKIISKNKHKSYSDFSTLTNSFNSYLEDTEACFVHKYKNHVSLFDIFIYPDLIKIEYKSNSLKKLISSDLLLSTLNRNENKVNKHFLIFGEDQSGKTSLCKKYFLDLLRLRYTPIYLEGDKIKSSNLDKSCKNAVIEQYEFKSYLDYKEQLNKAIIIDNFERIKMNKNAMNKFMSNVKDFFDVIIILANDSYQLIVHELDIFSGFSLFLIEPLGHYKRTKLIEKWISLGREETINENNLYDHLDNIQVHINTFVKNNIVPAKPVYILIILQRMENITSNKFELTSYGHCYQYLIYQSLEKAKINYTEIDRYFNYLTEFSFYIFLKKQKSINKAELNDFYEQYTDKYLSIDQNVTLKNLLSCGILKYDEGKYSFRHKYIYYFYVARYISENISNSIEIKRILSDLVDNLHIEENANIIIFVTHHNKDNYILDEIQLSMMQNFENFQEATLSSDLHFFDETFLQLKNIIIENKRVETVRAQNDVEKDRYELINEKKSEKEKKQRETLDSHDIFAILYKSFKSIEIAGQIIRNRYGSLPKSTLFDIADDAYGVGLRTLSFFLKTFENSKSRLINIIVLILNKYPNLATTSIENKAQKIYTMVIYTMIFIILRNISFSIGSKEASEIYNIIKNKKKSPAVILINSIIELNFSKKFDIDMLQQIYQLLDGNITCQVLFKEIVVQHIYMHNISYKQKQRVSEIFNIPMSFQRSIANISVE